MAMVLTPSAVLRAMIAGCLLAALGLSSIAALGHTHDEDSPEDCGACHLVSTVTIGSQPASVAHDPVPEGAAPSYECAQVRDEYAYIASIRGPPSLSS